MIKTITRISRYISFTLIMFLISMCIYTIDTYAQTYDLTLPRWDKNVFAISGQTWGYTDISQGSYAGYNGVYKSPTVALPNSGNLAYQMVTSNMFYSTDTYKIEFYLTGMVMKHVQSVSVNDYICEIKKSSDLTLLVTCNNVKFNKYTYDGRDWNTFLIRAYYDMPDNSSTTSNFGVVSSINISKTDVEEDINNSINNSNTTDANNKGNSFFDGFTTTDHGGISGIVTAPLNAINQMINGTCVPLTTTYHGKELSLPCGSDFWNKIPEIKNFWNLIGGGLLCYSIIIKLFKLIEKMKNPDEDRIEVLEL